MLLYTRLAHLAVADMTRTVAALSHIDPSRLLVVAANRSAKSNYGNLAQCIGLGLDEHCDVDFWYQPRRRLLVKASPWYRLENTSVTIDQRQMRYIIRLQLPRLIKHRPVTTLVHELMHIGPDFDGRLNDQRHGKTFDSWVEACAHEWRERGDRELVETLSMGLGALQKKYGSLVALGFGPRFMTPRKVALDEQPPLESHPEIRRKRLKTPRGGVRRVDDHLSPLDAVGAFTEEHLVYRVFTAEASRRIGASALRASGSVYPPLTGDDRGIPNW